MAECGLCFSTRSPGKTPSLVLKVDRAWQISPSSCAGRKCFAKRAHFGSCNGKIRFGAEMSFCEKGSNFGSLKKSHVSNAPAREENNLLETLSGEVHVDLLVTLKLNTGDDCFPVPATTYVLANLSGLSRFLV